MMAENVINNRENNKHGKTTIKMEMKNEERILLV